MRVKAPGKSLCKISLSKQNTKKQNGNHFDNCCLLRKIQWAEDSKIILLI